jgi:DNA-binding response OmpR family regulator
MKILLAEDEIDWGTLIYRILDQEEYIIDWVKDGISAWDFLDTPNCQYTIVILDLTLPGNDGVEICRRLREQQNSVLIMLLTTFDHWEYAISGLNIGADDYLTKPFHKEELLAKLRALRRRSPQFRPLQLQFGQLILNCDDRTLYWHFNSDHYQSIILSRKEFQLLEHFMQNPHRAIKQENIFNYLYQAEIERTSNVVAAQIRRLRRRLLELGCHNLIQTLPGGYYRLNPEFNLEEAEQ